MNKIIKASKDQTKIKMRTRTKISKDKMKTKIRWVMTMIRTKAKVWGKVRAKVPTRKMMIWIKKTKTTWMTKKT